MARIERVSYRSGFVKRLGGAAHLPAITTEAADLPEDVLALLDRHLLDLGGTNGDPNAGDPIQYDELRIEHDQGEVEIVVYNRVILLFTTDSEAVRWIHRVCCRLDDIAARSCRTGQTGLVKLYKWVALSRAFGQVGNREQVLPDPGIVGDLLHGDDRPCMRLWVLNSTRARSHEPATREVAFARDGLHEPVLGVV